MKCYHLFSVQPVFAGGSWLQVSPTAWLMVHDDGEGACPDEPKAGHLLLQDPIPSAFATALASYNVLPTDTVAQMAIKMGKVFRPFHP